MDYDNKRLIADFANRTLHNLQLIRGFKESQPGREAFEVTQLVNSMLGLLVFPKERDYERIPETSLAELKSKGWPIPEFTLDHDQTRTLKDLLRLMRNAVAHCNIRFLPNENNEIAGILVWNNRGGRTGRRSWEWKLTLEELDRFASHFIALLTE